MAAGCRGSMAVTYSTGPNKSSSLGAEGEVALTLPSSMGPMPSCCITSLHLTVFGVGGGSFSGVWDKIGLNIQIPLGKLEMKQSLGAAGWAGRGPGSQAGRDS